MDTVLLAACPATSGLCQDLCYHPTVCLLGTTAFAWQGTVLGRETTCNLQPSPTHMSQHLPPPHLALSSWNQVYVIGGLVDRTVQKGASLRLAQRHRARAVRLPIAEHLGSLAKGKGVLNVNDVFAALLAVHAGHGWRAALEAAIPQRFRQVPMAPAASNPTAATTAALAKALASNAVAAGVAAGATSVGVAAAAADAHSGADVRQAAAGHQLRDPENASEQVLSAPSAVADEGAG